MLEHRAARALAQLAALSQHLRAARAALEKAKRLLEEAPPR